MLAPKNGWSEYYFPIGFRHIFRGYVSFFLGGGRYHIIGLENIRYSSETWPLATRILDHQLRDASPGVHQFYEAYQLDGPTLEVTPPST